MSVARVVPVFADEPRLNSQSEMLSIIGLARVRSSNGFSGDAADRSWATPGSRYSYIAPAESAGCILAADGFLP